ITSTDRKRKAQLLYDECHTGQTKTWANLSLPICVGYFWRMNLICNNKIAQVEFSDAPNPRVA
ncbi:MAG TPA: hypothetical protein VN364_03205, partial [Bellilinea sp.]|nr:hypothetical protein [Bellilinea sp.]